MRRYTLLFIIVALAGPRVDAQRDEGASLGVRLGGIVSLYDFPGLETTSPPGVSLGFFSSAPIDAGFYFQPELYATYERAEVSGLPGSDASAKLQFLYAECTFMAAYRPADRFLLHAGPFVGYLAHYKAEGGWPDSTGANVFDRENFNDVNLGFIYGATYEVSRFDLGLRFNHGLFTLGKELARSSMPDALKTKNSYFQAFLAYLF